MKKILKIFIITALVLASLFNFFPIYSFEFIGAHREYYGFGATSFIREWFNGLAWDHPWNRLYIQWNGVIINATLALALSITMIFCVSKIVENLLAFSNKS
jgi:hypothetical protein